MQLIDLVKRSGCPAPWSEVEKIPWDEPEHALQAPQSRNCRHKRFAP